MVTASHRVLLPLLVLIFVPPAFSVPAPDLIQANQTPAVLLAIAAPTEPLSPPVTRLSAFPFTLSTCATNTYPAYDCSPYAQKLDRGRRAVSLRDRWKATWEMRACLNMLSSRAGCGSGDSNLKRRI